MVLLSFFIAGIILMNGSLLSVSDDLNTQQIQMNCVTFKVEPNQVTWKIKSLSTLITSNSSNQPVNVSDLLNSTEMIYRHSIILNESFSDGTNISCTTTVNGETKIENYTLQGMSEYSFMPLICSSVLSILFLFILYFYSCLISST